MVVLEPWFSNRTKSIVKSPKIYLADTGLLCALLNIRSADALRESPAAGAVWETFVFAQLRAANGEPDAQAVCSSGVIARARWISWSISADSWSSSKRSGPNCRPRVMP